MTVVTPLFPPSQGKRHRDKDRCRQCPKDQVEEIPTPIRRISEEQPYAHEASRKRGDAVPHRSAWTQDCGEHDADHKVHWDRLKASKQVAHGLGVDEGGKGHSGGNNRTGCKFQPPQNSLRLMSVKAISWNPR